MHRLFLVLALVCAARADIVVFENGDRLSGKVLTMSESELKLKNEIQGTVTLPREKIASIHFKEAVTGPAVGALPNAGSVLKQLEGGNETDRAIEQVQNDLLAGASPEAQQMYREMVRDLMSGKLQLGDIRAQAQTTLNELRSLEKELGDDGTSELLGSYAAILENFLKATPPAAESAPKSQAPAAQPEAAE